MFQYKIILAWLLTALMVAPAHCQVKPEIHPIKMMTGRVINMDAVGNVITIRTDVPSQMAFFVPDKASITNETHDIGLMDITVTDPVTIQYYVSSPAKYTVVSIVDNKAPATE